MRCAMAGPKARPSRSWVRGATHRSRRIGEPVGHRVLGGIASPIRRRGQRSIRLIASIDGSEGSACARGKSWGGSGSHRKEIAAGRTMTSTTAIRAVTTPLRQPMTRRRATRHAPLQGGERHVPDERRLPEGRPLPPHQGGDSAAMIASPAPRRQRLGPQRRPPWASLSHVRSGRSRPCNDAEDREQAEP